MEGTFRSRSWSDSVKEKEPEKMEVERYDGFLPRSIRGRYLSDIIIS